MRIFWPAFDRGELIRRLEDGVRRLAANLPLSEVVLFGSHARGAATVASDVDLLIVYSGAPRADAYALAKHAFDVPRLEPHLYTDDQYCERRPVLDRMLRDGIRLYFGSKPGA